MKLISSKTKKYLTEFVEDIDKHEIFLLSASIAYTTALALAPFVLILLSVASLLGPEMQQKLSEAMTSTIGPKAGEAINVVIKSTKEHPSLSSISSIIGFVILVVSASAIFTQLRIALNKINEHKATKQEGGLKGFIKDKVFSVGLVFGFAFLSVVSLILSSVMTAVFPGGEGFLLKTLNFFVNFLMFSTVFTLIYHFIPTDKLTWKTCAISGITSTIFYLIGKGVIGVYLGKAAIVSSYGAAGSLIAFLIWVYYTALTLLVSYEFSKVLVLKKVAGSSSDRRKLESKGETGRRPYAHA